MKVMAIEKREDVSPEEGKKKYGSDVPFADEKNKKYPLDKEHIHAAISYWGMQKNRAKYSAEDQKKIGARIRQYAKKWGVEMADDDGDKSDKTESSLVYAAASIDLDGQTPPEIVYMPKGEEIVIRPLVGGKGKTVALKVDASVAEVLQADLAKRLEDPIRPFAGFDHQRGAASFLPKEFWWDDERGVILEVDWTEKGKNDVVGRNYSYFSPTFMLKGKTVAGLPATGEVGSMTNDPAFRTSTMKIAAAAADDNGDDKEEECPKCGHNWNPQADPGEQTQCPECGAKFKRPQKTESMAQAIAEKLFELDVITAEQAQGADEEFVIRAISGLHEALTVARATNARLQTENTALAAKVADVQKAEATTIVQAAVAEGKIPAKDQGAIDFWTAQLSAQPESAKKVLASMPVNPLLQRVIDVRVKDTKRVAAGQSEADLVQAQHRAVRMVKEKHPNLSHDDAFNRAKEEYPEAFPVEA